MPDEELTHWGRGDRVLQAYEKINADPGMVYVTDRNNNDVRIFCITARTKTVASDPTPTDR